MSNDYRGVPIPQTPEQKAAFDKTYRSVFGTRVKIPPPGPEREALCRRIGKAVFPRDYDSMSYATEWGEERGKANVDNLIERVLTALEEEG